MCGINGFLGIEKNQESLINKMNIAINHRGPDDSGFFVNKEMWLGLWQVRLSIIDLSDAGYQPMFYNKQDWCSNEKNNKEFIKKWEVCIVFNWEIYNYKEIRENLKSLGYTFTSKTDTEVVCAAYLEYGEDCVKHFNGMRAFCIYNVKESQLFLSRDITGKKPLFYYQDKWVFLFASELKSIMEHNIDFKLSEKGLDLYNSLSYIPSPYSIFKKVYKLEPRHNMIYDIKTWKINIKKYYDFPKFKPVYNKKVLVKEWVGLINRAVARRMVADVPVWAFLSWWLDSSTVVAIMKKHIKKNVHTFSLWFKNFKEDETSYINIIKDHLKTIHHHEYFKESDFDKYLPKVAYHFDEPAADSAFFSNLKVAELAKWYVTVSLTWDGGDEIFGWYNKHKLAAKIELLKKLPVRLRTYFFRVISLFKNTSDFTAIWKLREIFRISLTKPEDFFIEIFPNINYYWPAFKERSREKMKEMLSVYWNLTESVIKYDLFYNSTSDRFLQKVDRTSMAYALECRCPFLDKEIIEYSCKIPTKWKTNGFKTKIMLRWIVKDLLPKKIIKWSKKWFWTPLKIFIKNYTWDIEFFKDNSIFIRKRFFLLWKKTFLKNNKNND